jgi:hypothetical protein
VSRILKIEAYLVEKLESAEEAMAKAIIDYR